MEQKEKDLSMGNAGKAGMERTKKIGTFNTDGAGKVEVFSSKEGEGFDHDRQEGWAASRRVEYSHRIASRDTRRLSGLSLPHSVSESLLFVEGGGGEAWGASEEGE